MMISDEKKRARRALAAAVIGNTLEWYDFAVYGFLATILANHFFPSTDEVTSLLRTFAAFGVGFAARPIGGIIFGHLADRKGRKFTLVLTIQLMAAATLLIGILPTYGQIGLAAPIILVLARLLQGFSAGGEWGGGTAFIVEWAGKNKRGLTGSLQQISVAAGLLLGSGFAAILSTALDETSFVEWGWRIPFLLGAFIGVVGIYIRRNVDESPVFAQTTSEPSAVTQSDETILIPALRAFGFTIHWTVVYYIFLAYMPTFAIRHLHLERADALWSNAAGLLTLIILAPVTGYFSDKYGRKPFLIGSCIAVAVAVYPIFNYLLTSPTLLSLVCVQVFFGILIALYSGPGPAAIAELFDTTKRATGMSVGYSLAVAIFGGFAPFIATWLIDITNSPLSPAFYVLSASFITAAVIIRFPETAHRPLR